MLSKPSQPAQQVTLNDEATIDCPICLDTVSTPAFKLSCGHKFCEACLSTYATTIAGQQSSPATPKLACPCCVKTLSNSECSSLGIRLLVQSSATTPESQGWWALSHQRRTSNAAEENHGQAADLGRAAGRIPIRYCPYCRVPIIKEGGATRCAVEAANVASNGSKHAPLDRVATLTIILRPVHFAPLLHVERQQP